MNAYPPQVPHRRSSRLSIGLALVLVAALVVVGVLVYLLRNAEEGGEVLLQPTASEGPFPWTPSVVPANASTTVPPPPVAQPESKAPESGSTSQLAPVGGDSAGLYGGSTEMSVCDKEKLISFLENNPEKRAAWKGVLAVSDVRAYVESLTPVILTRDARVTNHGFENGRATSLQSVLQAGTAVLIDDHGVPTVRCQCGNPLLPPVLASAQPSYNGDRWAGFDAGRISVIQPPAAPITQITIIDLGSGDRITIDIPRTGGLLPSSRVSASAPSIPAELAVDGTYALTFTLTAGKCGVVSSDVDITRGPPLRITGPEVVLTGNLASDNSFQVRYAEGSVTQTWGGVFVQTGDSVVIQNGTVDLNFQVGSCQYTFVGQKK